jgi:hypothetical protein
MNIVRKGEVYELNETDLLCKDSISHVSVTLKIGKHCLSWVSCPTWILRLRVKHAGEAETVQAVRVSKVVIELPKRET